jgi:hypothetical protein
MSLQSFGGPHPFDGLEAARRNMNSASWAQARWLTGAKRNAHFT